MQPGTVPGGVLELCANRAKLALSPGVNSPLTTQFYDTSGSGNHGTLTGFAGTTASGWAGSGTTADPYRLVSDGVSGVVNLPAAVSPGLSDFTAEAWVKLPSGVTNNYGNVIGTGSWLQAKHWGIWNLSESDRVYCSIGDGVYANHKGASVYLPDSGDVWHHVVATFDRDGAMKRYLDGAPYSSDVDISSLAAENLNAAPTMCWYSGWYTQQDIAVVRVYHSVLTAAQVAQNCAAGLPLYFGPNLAFRTTLMPSG